jgi:hypothetical protein
MIPRESLAEGSMSGGNCPLVIVRWQDSAHPISSWRHLSDLPRTRAIECATVGWLLKDDDEVKVVCQSVGDLESPLNAQASGIMTIPTRCVLSIERLTEDGELTSSAAAPADLADLAGDPKTASAPMRPEFESHPR